MRLTYGELLPGDVVERLLDNDECARGIVISTHDMGDDHLDIVVLIEGSRLVRYKTFGWMRMHLFHCRHASCFSET